MPTEHRTLTHRGVGLVISSPSYRMALTGHFPLWFASARARAPVFADADAIRGKPFMRGETLTLDDVIAPLSRERFVA